MSEIFKIGAMIRFHRKMAKLSQLDLAKFADVGKTVIFDLEQGKETVKFSTLIKVLEALNITITFDGPLMDLFEKEQDEKS